MTFKIEKDIPIPARQAKGMKKYPFADLEIGDSFFVPFSDGQSPSGLFSAISQAKRRLEIDLFSAKVEGGRRVWRISRLGAKAEADAPRRPVAQTGREVVHDLPEGGKPSQVLS